MYELDHKEGWMPKNCFWIVALEKTLQSLLYWKEIKLVNLKGNQPWIFIGRTDVDAEDPILWPPDAKSQFIGKDPNAGKEWTQKEKGLAEVKMVRQHHWLNGQEFELMRGDSGGQGSLGAAVHGGTKSWIQLSRWTTTTTLRKSLIWWEQRWRNVRDKGLKILLVF